MEKVAYQKVLFRTAMCVMACDGEIHESEVEEIKLAFEQTDFFRDLIFKEELDSVIRDFERNEKKVVMDYFDTIATSILSPVQKLQILEIILRIIYADDRVDDNEVHFLAIVKVRLKIPDEIFYKRFGEISCLRTGYDEIKINNVTDSFFDKFELPAMKDISNIFKEPSELKIK